MALSLYLLRHGETEASQSGVYCGRLDTDLTESGRLMARDFAEVYKGHQFAAIYVSPLRRARATAEPLCRAMGLEMTLRDGLRELDYGQWEGMTPETVSREFRKDYYVVAGRCGLEFAVRRRTRRGRRPQVPGGARGNTTYTQ